MGLTCMATMKRLMDPVYAKELNSDATSHAAKRHREHRLLCKVVGWSVGRLDDWLAGCMACGHNELGSLSIRLNMAISTNEKRGNTSRVRPKGISAESFK